MLAALYWAGGSGINLWWATAGNWTVGSGGAKSTSPPGPSDDVYFDAKSNALPPLVQAATSIGSLHLLAGYTGEIDLKANVTVGTTLGSDFLGGTIDSKGTKSSLTINGNLDWRATTVTGGTNLTTNSITTVDGSQANLDAATWFNNGTVNVNPAGILDNRNGSGVFNYGTFNVTSGPVLDSVGSSNFDNLKSAVLKVADTLKTTYFYNAGSLTLNAGGTVTFTNGDQKDSAAATTLFNGGSMTASSGYTVASGTLTGSAAGSTITGNLTNSGGTIDPGGTTGILSISGKYTQNSGTLSVGVDFTKKTNSSLAVGGMVTLADTLNVNFTGNPGRGTTWKIITYGATAGTDFATLTSNTGLKYVHVKPDVNNTYFIQIPNLQGQGVNFNILEGNSVGPIVADFTDPALADPSTGNYSAVIDWGDGTPTTTASTADNTIYPDGNGGWNILAVHPYADEGTYTITDVLTPDGDPAGVLTMSSTATVADQVTRASAVNGSATVGVPFSGVVATLTDANPLATADDFNVIIHWPDDGSASPGTVTGPTGGPFNVNGNHTFQSPGRWTLGVSIQDASAMLATANPTITVMPGGPGGMGGAAATSAARTTTAPPATGGTSVVFAIPMPDTALPMTEPPAAPSPGVASAPNPLPLSAPPATPDAAPALSPDAFDPRASYLAALAASDAAAGPLAGPDAYFASLS